MIADFSSASDPSLGLRILKTFKFDQNKTDISQLLQSSISLFKSGRECSLQIPEQMLIILGDGRDMLANGITDIKKVGK
jgi:midasin (ATPase involved in ribosome maturation)